ncbi:MAG: 16S rRNA (uracil(1498)-N(3))-methyltransferase [Deltaproteobacteria bacterium]|nr:16S rRNA (uracil(1498)-N(3))-methyltransferase [Deltaproteobacteria bacterium]
MLRLRQGAAVQLFDGEGRRAAGVLREGGVVLVEHVAAAPPVPAPRVTLLCALSKGDKVDLVVEKVSELGAVALRPVLCVRSVVKLDDERAASRLDRWQRVAEAAARQCGRDHALVVLPALAFDAALAADTSDHRRILEPGAPPLSAGLPPDATTVALFTGPEGGFDPGELERAERAGFQRAGLGPLTLRAETAPLVALAAVLARAGRL